MGNNQINTVSSLSNAHVIVAFNGGSVEQKLRAHSKGDFLGVLPKSKSVHFILQHVSLGMPIKMGTNLHHCTR